MIGRDSTKNADIWLLNLPPTRRQRRWAVAVAACQVAALILLTPFAGIQLSQINSFIPTVEGIIFVTDLLTAMMLFSQFAAYRQHTALILACGYLSSALIIIPHALSFPDAFSPAGLLGAGLQTTGWLYFFWHFLFSFALMGYALTKDKKLESGPTQMSSRGIVFQSVVLVLALACGSTLLATTGNDYLPALFADKVNTMPAADVVGAIMMLVCVCTFAVLWFRRRSLLDQWLVIVALAEVLEVGTAVVISPGRFDLGFYAGRLFSLLASTVVLVVLLVETTWLYADLVRSKEGKIRRLVDANIIGIIIGNLDGTITDSNDAFLRMLGYNHNDVARKGLNWMDMVPAEWREVNEKRAAEIKSTGIAPTYEMQLFRKDGGRVPVLCGAATFDEARGQAVAFVLDLTERKRADEVLRQSEERAQAEEKLRVANEVELSRAHRALIDAQRLSRTGSYIADLAANEHSWSEELYRIFEFPLGTKIDIEELLAMVHPDDRVSFEAALQLARTKGIGPDHYFRIKTQSGKLKHLHSSAAGILNSDGRIEIVGALQDVTEQKAVEETLRRSEAFLARGQTLSQTGTFSLRLATEEFTWSEQLYRIYEFEPDVHITFEKIATRYHPDDKAIIAGVIEQARRGVMDFDYTHRLLMPNGSIKHIHVVSHGSYGKDGQLEYFGGAQDITQRNLADEALNKARTELAHMARVTSLGALTASIAHEVNQPLFGITTNAGTCLRMLTADFPDLDGARETVRRTIRDANRAAEIISRLRALFSKKETLTETVNLNEASREIISLLMNELKNSRVILKLELADHLPTVDGDRIQLQQVLLNLIRNAADAMCNVDDRARHLVMRTARADPDGVLVAIQDSGPGIDPANLERVFDAFFTTKTDGLGIGLSVSRTIVETHGGKLWATTAVPQGAIFQFTLPTAQAGVHRERGSILEAHA